MCGRFLDSEPCVNYRCPHNLPWDGLKLNLSKIQITDKTLEIGKTAAVWFMNHGLQKRLELHGD